MDPYYERDGITIYHGDCREILPTLDKVDLVLNRELRNSTESASIGDHGNPKSNGRKGAKAVGVSSRGNRMALRRAAMVDGSDSQLLPGFTDGNEQGNAATGDQVARTGTQGSAERSLQGRKAERLLSATDREGQVFDVQSNGTAGGSSQERGSLRQSVDESSDPLRELPQPTSQKAVVEAEKIAIVTDPPYGIGLAANPFRQKFDSEAWDDTAPLEVARWLAKANCDVIIWGGNYFGLPPTQRFLIWDKQQPENFSSAMAEMAWSNLQGPAKIFRCHPFHEFRKNHKFHPTCKPLSLMKWCIKFTDAETILDPFMGSGTTLRAAKDLGRKAIGIEIEEKYCEIAANRLAQGVLNFA